MKSHEKRKGINALGTCSHTMMRQRTYVTFRGSSQSYLLEDEAEWLFF